MRCLLFDFYNDGFFFKKEHYINYFPIHFLIRITPQK